MGPDSDGYRSQALSAALSRDSINARLARHPAGDGAFASRLFGSAVSKHRATGVMMSTCGADRGSVLLKYA
jgi:hypothetical protein